MAGKSSIIGRIAIKVLPDTTDFREKAQAELDKIEKKLEVKVKLVPDADEFKRHTEEIKERVEKGLGDLDIKVDLAGTEKVKREIAELEAELRDINELDIDVDLKDVEEIKARLKKLREELSDKGITFDLKIDPKSEQSLKAAYDKIRAELARRRELQVKIAPDTPSLERAAAEIKRKLDTAAKARLEIDDRKVRAELRAFEHEVASANWVAKLTVDPRTVAKAREQIEKLARQIAELEATITVDMDEDSRRKTDRQIDELKHKISDLKAEVKPELGQIAKDKTAGELAILARDRIVNIIPRIAQGPAAKVAATLAILSGLRIAKDIGDYVKNLFENIDRLAISAGIMTLKLGALALALLTATANTLAFGSSLASIVPIGLALPGVFGGMLVGLTVVIVALKDFKKYVPEVSQAWGQIKKTISENFWAKAAAPIRDMVDKLLPIFVAGFRQASTEIGSYFGGLAHDLKNSFQPTVKGMFADLSESVRIFTAHTSSLANIITVLGTKGAGLLPRLASFVGKLSDQFSAFLSKAASNGDFDKWINTAIAAAKSFGSVLSSVFKIFSSINDAAKAAGGSTLSILADTLKKIAKTVDSPAFKGALTDVFRAAFTAVNNLTKLALPALGTLFKTLAGTAKTVLPQIGTTIGTLVRDIALALASPAVQQGIKDLVGGVSAAIRALSPAFAALAPVAGALGSALGGLLRAIGPVVSQLIVALAPALAAIFRAIGQVAPLLGQFISSTIQALAPIIPPLVDAFDKIVKALITSLAPQMPALVQAMVAFGQAMADLLVALAPLLPSLVTLAVKVFVPGFALALKGAALGMEALATFVSQLTPFLKPLLDGLSKLSTLLGSSLTPKLGDLNGAMHDGQQILRDLGGAFSFVWNLIKQTVVQAVSYIASTILNFVGSLRSLWSTTWQSIGQIVSTTWGLIKAIVSVGIDTLQRIFSNALSIIGAIWSSIWSNVKRIFTDAIPGLLSIAAALPGRILSALGNGAKQLYRWGVDLILGLIAGAASGVVKLVQFIASLPGKIVGALGDLGSLLKNAGKSVIGGFIDGIKGAAGGVKSLLGDITDSLTSWKGPPERDAIILRPAGRQVIQGFIDGINDKVPAVRDTLLDFTATLAPTAKSLWSKLLIPDLALAKTARGTVQRIVEEAIRPADLSPQKLAGVYGTLFSQAQAATYNVSQYAKTTAAKATAGVSAAQAKLNGQKANLAELKKDGAELQVQLAKAKAELAAAKRTKDKGDDGAAQARVDQLSAAVARNRAEQTSLSAAITKTSAALAAAKDYAQKAASKYGQLSDVAKQAAQQAAEAARDLVSSLSSQYDALEQKIGDFKSAVKAGFTGLDLSSIFQGLITSDENGNQVLPTLDQIKDKLSSITVDAKQFASDLNDLAASGAGDSFIEQIASLGTQAGAALAKQLLAAGPEAIKAFQDSFTALDKITDDIANRLADHYYGAGAASMQKYIQGLVTQFPELGPALQPIFDDLNGLFGTYAPGAPALKAITNTAKPIGDAIGDGVAAGIKASVPSVLDSVHQLSASAVAQMRKDLGIHSPSRVFREMGQFTTAGFLVGLESRYGDVTDSLAGFGQNLALAGNGAALAAAGRAVSSTQTTDNSSRTVIYHAAPNNSLSAEDELDAVLARAGGNGW